MYVCATAESPTQRMSTTAKRGCILLTRAVTMSPTDGTMGRGPAGTTSRYGRGVSCACRVCFSPTSEATIKLSLMYVPAPALKSLCRCDKKSVQKESGARPSEIPTTRPRRSPGVTRADMQRKSQWA